MPLTLDDRQQVEDLLVRYSYAVDTDGGEDAFAEMFTEDAVLIGTRGHRTGMKAVRELARTVTDRKGFQARHIITNVLIEGDSGEARIRAYFTEYYTYNELLPPKLMRTSELIYVGTFDCTAVKVSGSWKFSRRVVHCDAP